MGNGMPEAVALAIAFILWSPVWLFVVGLVCGLMRLPKEGLGK